MTRNILPYLKKIVLILPIFSCIQAFSFDSYILKQKLFINFNV